MRDCPAHWTRMPQGVARVSAISTDTLVNVVHATGRKFLECEGQSYLSYHHRARSGDGALWRWRPGTCGSIVLVVHFSHGGVIWEEAG